MHIERDCFELAEFAEHWGLSDAVIRYLVAKALLSLSVHLIGQPAQVACVEEMPDGEQVWVPYDERVVHEIADLPVRDAFLLVRDGQIAIRDVFLPDDTRLTVRGGAGLQLLRQDALVRREAWTADEEWVLQRGTAGTGAFDFRQFVYEDCEFAFTHQQALALRFMIERTQAGAPDQHYLEILKAAGSESQRIGSLFSRKPYWCHLLRKTPGRRGWYYLDPAFVVWLTRSA